MNFLKTHKFFIFVLFCILLIFSFIFGYSYLTGSPIEKDTGPIKKTEWSKNMGDQH